MEVKKLRKQIGTVIAAVATAVFLTACGVLQKPPTPSAPLEAQPLEIEEAPQVDDAAADATEPTPGPMATETAVEDAQPDEPAAAAEDAAATAAPIELTIYTISQEASQVRFELDEDLRGERITVVGTTNQVAGQIGVNLADLSGTQVGVIQINARALATDNNLRNRAIQNEILQTGAYEFITFTPTAVNGLPASAAVGDEIAFTIDGQLTIRDVTEPVTFNVTAAAVSDTQISGTATAVVSRDAYGLRIPSVPNVANVEEEVELIITFTANAG